MFLSEKGGKRERDVCFGVPLTRARFSKCLQFFRASGTSLSARIGVPDLSRILAARFFNGLLLDIANENYEQTDRERIYDVTDCTLFRLYNIFKLDVGTYNDDEGN